MKRKYEEQKPQIDSNQTGNKTTNTNSVTSTEPGSEIKKKMKIDYLEEKKKQDTSNKKEQKQKQNNLQIPPKSKDILNCMIHLSFECLYYDLLQKKSILKACKINPHENQYICSESCAKLGKKCPLCREEVIEISANERSHLLKQMMICQFCNQHINSENYSIHILEKFNNMHVQPYKQIDDNKRTLEIIGFLRSLDYLLESIQIEHEGSIQNQKKKINELAKNDPSVLMSLWATNLEDITKPVNSDVYEIKFNNYQTNFYIIIKDQEIIKSRSDNDIMQNNSRYRELQRPYFPFNRTQQFLNINSPENIQDIIRLDDHISQEFPQIQPSDIRFDLSRVHSVRRRDPNIIPTRRSIPDIILPPQITNNNQNNNQANNNNNNNTNNNINNIGQDNLENLIIHSPRLEGGPRMSVQLPIHQPHLSQQTDSNQNINNNNNSNINYNNNNNIVHSSNNSNSLAEFFSNSDTSHRFLTNAQLRINQRERGISQHNINRNYERELPQISRHTSNIINNTTQNNNNAGNIHSSNNNNNNQQNAITINDNLMNFQQNNSNANTNNNNVPIINSSHNNIIIEEEYDISNATDTEGQIQLFGNHNDDFII